MKRRDFLVQSTLLAGSLNAQVCESTLPHVPAGSITDVEGVKVGHFTESKRPTGCTVLLTEEGATGGVDVRGGAPGTRDTELLNPVNTVEKVNAIVLAGGSAFGLAAADGVVRYLEEKGFGYQAGKVRVPIVPAAILIDLAIGDSSIRPTAESGYKACKAASIKPPEQGTIGAGAGATIGKMMGYGRAMKGGFGTASIRMANGLVVGAMVAVNAVGDVYDHLSGKLIAGARTADGKQLADVMNLIRKGELPGMQQGSDNTTIGAVATNAELTKAQATKIAQMAHDGYARAIRPVHTPADGDTIFSLGTGKLKLPMDRWLGILGALAADVMAEAIVSAVQHAKSIPGFPALADLGK
jgi:L-aminopeptidase/D-esterase-like protein